MVEENTSPTKFNMAVATLMRLDVILKNCSYFASVGDLISWHESLLTLRRNIIPFIKETEIQQITRLTMEINFNRWLMRDKGKLKIIPSQIGRIWQLLDNLEVTMQKAMKEAGLLMPKSDDPRFALEQ